jgi:predicted GNAT family acetyltransferase
MSHPLPPIEHEERARHGEFFIALDGTREARMIYRRLAESLVSIDHTEVAPELSGQGIARRLLDAAVAWARETGTRFVVTCPYATAQFDRDPSIRDVLA